MAVLVGTDVDDSEISPENAKIEIRLLRTWFDRDEKLEHSELDGIKQVESSPSIA